jgi:hypothetical protein
MYNTIGLAGGLLFLVSYYLVQRGTMTDHDPRYLGMNLAGSIALIASLCWAWNLPAFILEIVWGLISIYGLIRAGKKIA